LETFLTLGVIYFVAMMCGAFGYRIPAPGWKPANWTPKAKAADGMITHGHVHVNVVHRIPQFWLLWAVLCLNVSAGIGIIGMASPMLQEVFGGRLISVDSSLLDLSQDDKVRVASVGAGFAALLSLFNILGRLFWASLSDHIGRKWTYHIFFAGGMALYLAAALLGNTSVMFFVVVFCVILTMYGGGFATIPAYLADLFGTQFVGAIHGRLLTAWSTAGILGPVLVNYLREFQLDRGVPPEAAYTVTLHVLAGLLLLGFICNLAVRPVAERFMMRPEELAEVQKTAENGQDTPPPAEDAGPVRLGLRGLLALGFAWAFVGVPLVWGVYKTLEKAAGLFH
jgi:MFS family permease